MSIGGPAWGVVIALMLAALLAVFVVRLRRSGPQGTSSVAIGVVVGLVVAGVALLLALGSR